MKHHIPPLKYYLGTAIALLVLTLITVYTAKNWDLGIYNVPLALSIAVGKATLVILFFMGLRWDKGFNILILVSTLMFFLIFVFFTLADTLMRDQPDTVEMGTHDLKQIVSPVVEGREQGKSDPH